MIKGTRASCNVNNENEVNTAMFDFMRNTEK